MSKQVTFVVGAGASNEFNLPLGFELKNQIASLLQLNLTNDGLVGERNFCSAIEQACNFQDFAQRAAFFKAACKIRSAAPLTTSIDNLIASHNDDPALVFCAKLAIAFLILQAEANSPLCPRNGQTHIDFANVKQSWLHVLLGLISEECPRETLHDRLARLTFVIFNYDRCVEHFMHHALMAFYDLDDEEAASALDQVRFFHPYGSIGGLPWQKHATKIPFGASYANCDMSQCVDNIKTFSQHTKMAEPESDAIKAAMAESDTVVFLGFAFHPINIELLKPKVVKNDETRKSIATTVKVSKYDVDHHIIPSIRGIRGHLHPIVQDHPCAEVLGEYRRAINLRG